MWEAERIVIGVKRKRRVRRWEDDDGYRRGGKWGHLALLIGINTIVGWWTAPLVCVMGYVMLERYLTGAWGAVLCGVLGVGVFAAVGAMIVGVSIIADRHRRYWWVYTFVVASWTAVAFLAGWALYSMLSGI